MDIDTLLNRFRIASRELFNQFFHVDDPYNSEDAWVREARFRQIESLLFEKLVIEPAQLPNIPYRTRHPDIRVELRHGPCAPITLNREIDSGYWDYPLKEITQDAKLAFVAFFDWDQLDYRDYRYVRVVVAEWPSRPAVVGKHAFIETHYVRFSLNLPPL